MNPSFMIPCGDCKTRFQPKTLAERYCPSCKKKRKNKANNYYKKNGRVVRRQKVFDIPP